MRKFYWLVLRQGWASYFSRIKSGTRQVILFSIQTTILFLLLYFQPWVGDFNDEARLAAAGGAAFLVSALLNLIWELIKAPAILHKQYVSEISRLSGALGLVEDLSRIAGQGAGILERWEEAQRCAANRDASHDIARVEAEAERFIKDHYTSSELLSYRYGQIMLVEPAPAGTVEFYQQRYRRFINTLTYGQLISENRIHHFKAKTQSN